MTTSEPKFERDSTDLIRGYFGTVKRVLLTPSAFFRELPLEGGLSKPLTFALVTHWIGSAFTYVWAMLAGNAVEKLANKFAFSVTSQGPDIDSAARFSRWMAVQQQAAHWFWTWFWGAGSIILDPFKTLLTIFITSMFIYVAARLFVNSDRQTNVRYESAVRLVSYGTTPAILAAFPFVGSFAAYIYVLVVTLIGARELYRVGSGRAMLIVLFPYLLFVGIIAMGVLLLAFLALKMAVSVV
jgi:hypothetical protein